jgi:hypothetical protein
MAEASKNTFPQRRDRGNFTFVSTSLYVLQDTSPIFVPGIFLTTLGHKFHPHCSFYRQGN